MTYSPVYQDVLTHSLYGKSRLPIFILEKRMQFNYPLHHHNFAELSIVLGGSGTEILNGKPHRFHRGTVSLLLPHHMHEILIDRPNVHKFNCMFDFQLLFSCPTDVPLANDLLRTGKELPSHYELDEEDTQYMEQLFIAMQREYESEHYAKDSLLRSKLLEALVFLVRSAHRSAAALTPALPAPSKMLDLLQYVHLHFQEEITLTSLARTFNWHPSYISRIFKQHVGQTLTDYLHALRVEMASSLLATTTMNIVDIAFEVGFEHPHTFTRVFKELRGMPPKQYREATLTHKPRD